MQAVLSQFHQMFTVWICLDKLFQTIDQPDGKAVLLQRSSSLGYICGAVHLCFRKL